MSVLVETTLGDFVIDLFLEERPNTCKNFLKLCKVKYYNFCGFHSIQQHFIAQTGDPTGTGRGGESIFASIYGDQARYIEQENTPEMKHLKPGTISMVNNGENGHGSQFFITLAENLDYLDGVHTIFGQITEGLDIVGKLNDVICDSNNRPYIDVLINHTIILHDPYPDDKDLKIPKHSPSPSFELLKTLRIGIDENLDENAGKTVEELQEEIESKDAKARAHVLEMVGDLHHADEKPPDNVLFICKLNSVTTDEDLEIIFSRFGIIKCCEIIRDKKTGNSLQYAFIEFENAKDCETAYFKMDNVLIDDRRIHVDFSQSVAKNFQWKRQVSNESEPKMNESENKHSKEKRNDEKTSKDKHEKSSKNEKHKSREDKNDHKRRKSKEKLRSESKSGSKHEKKKHRSRSRTPPKHHKKHSYDIEDGHSRSKNRKRSRSRSRSGSESRPRRRSRSPERRHKRR